MKKKKLYLGFFYGSKKELTDAFNKITDGDFIRYVVTAETLICRFKSNKNINEIFEILKQCCSDIPFFIFPISNDKWKYNLPLDVENNLLTDNPIIETPQSQFIKQLFMSVVNAIDKEIPQIKNEEDPNLLNMIIEDLNAFLKQAVAEDNFELAIKIRDKIKELTQQKKL